MKGPTLQLSEGATAFSFGSKTAGRTIYLFKVVVDGNNVIASAGFGGGGGGGGSCFKCGKTGLRARDCDGNSSVADPSLPEKACPSGLDTCLVLTASTDKNLGHKFYKCPVREGSWHADHTMEDGVAASINTSRVDNASEMGTRALV